ncbi:hypothetical protein Agabi119p4_9470 [Agaricus bisporus var. burnettii]|uniref:Uncharacterized protein n=1 Tax=Agaricus bisporus var. burnettii TaxID=192524 RepID=A0A8H7C3P4_AGABI|nr:hypothetical protein Agabi119p4_9470 [Agaricus bisporus var. burnettii]
MPAKFVLASLLLASLSSVVSAASSCIASDIHWNLLAFGFNGKDYDAGTQDSWTQGNATDITTTQGRPPFDGSNVTCYLSQFTNAIYFMGADASKPNDIHIYDATAKSWSTQAVQQNSFDPTSSGAILDHDTNVFYAYSGGDIYSLDMELLKAANNTPKAWNDVQKVDWDTSSYQPTVALGQNHIFFLGVPGVNPGSTRIFVIHFSYLQPEPQAFGDIPNMHGKTASIFKDEGVQTQFIYVPDDGSATYLLDVTSNTTQTLKAPMDKDAQATYFATTTAVIQLSSSGSVSYLPIDATNEGANSNSNWATVSNLPVATPAKPSSASGSASGTGSAGAQSTGSTSDGTMDNGAAVLNVGRWVWSAVALMVGAALF